LSCKDTNKGIIVNKQCDAFRNLEGGTEVKKVLTFEPRSGCGFFVYGKYSKAIFKYKMPISLFVSNYTMTTSDDPDTWSRDSLEL